MFNRFNKNRFVGLSQKPFRYAELNRNDYRTRNLIRAWIFTEGTGKNTFDSVGGYAASFYNYPSRVVWNGGIFGLCADMGAVSGSADPSEGVIPDIDPIATTDTFSVAVGFQYWTDGITNASMFTRGRDGSGAGWNIFLSTISSSNTISAAVVYTSPSLAQVTASGVSVMKPSSSYHAGMIWRPAVDIRVFFNGRLDGTTTTNGSSLRTSGVGTVIGGATQSSSPFGFFRSKIYYCYIWNVAVPPEYFYEININPYGLFTPSSHRRYFFYGVQAAVADDSFVSVG